MGIENPVHLAFIAIVALVVLGPKRLPELARALGHGIREFREAVGQGSEQTITQQPIVSESGQGYLAEEAGAAPQPVIQQPIDAQPVESHAAAPQAVDPPQQIPSGDAPDNRPL
jgi:TatA/E family protein of Tat protein translocase